MLLWWLSGILLCLACHLVLGERHAFQTAPSRTAVQRFPAGGAGKGGIQDTIEDLLDFFGYQRKPSVSKQASETWQHIACPSPQ